MAEFLCLLVGFVCLGFSPPSLKKRQGRSYCYYLNWDVVEAGEDGHKVDSPQRCMVKGRWAKATSCNTGNSHWP